MDAFKRKSYKDVKSGTLCRMKNGQLFYWSKKNKAGKRKKVYVKSKNDFAKRVRKQTCDTSRQLGSALNKRTKKRLSKKVPTKKRKVPIKKTKVVKKPKVKTEAVKPVGPIQVVTDNQGKPTLVDTEPVVIPHFTSTQAYWKTTKDGWNDLILKDKAWFLGNAPRDVLSLTDNLSREHTARGFQIEYPKYPETLGAVVNFMINQKALLLNYEAAICVNDQNEYAHAFYIMYQSTFQGVVDIVNDSSNDTRIIYLQCQPQHGKNGKITTNNLGANLEKFLGQTHVYDRILNSCFNTSRIQRSTGLSSEFFSDFCFVHFFSKEPCDQDGFREAFINLDYYLTKLEQQSAGTPPTPSKSLVPVDQPTLGNSSALTPPVNPTGKLLIPDEPKGDLGGRLGYTIYPDGFSSDRHVSLVFKSVASLLKQLSEFYPGKVYLFEDKQGHWVSQLVPDTAEKIIDEATSKDLGGTTYSYIYVEDPKNLVAVTGLVENGKAASRLFVTVGQLKAYSGIFQRKDSPKFEGYPDKTYLKNAMRTTQKGNYLTVKI